MNAKNVMGVDVSKDWLDLDTADNGPKKVKNSIQSWRQAIKLIHHEQISLVVMEATGGYERGFADLLVKNGIDVTIANPRHVRNFAKGLGLMAKTDKLDAEMLRTYGELVPTRLYEKPSKHNEILAALVKERMHLVRLAGQEMRRLKRATPAVRHITKAVHADLKKRIQLIEKELAKHISEDEKIAQNTKLLSQVKGISTFTAATLQGLLPELGKLNNKEIAALAGLAPYNRDSGKRRGARCIWGGRERVRRALWMCAVCASTYNPKIRLFYQRLREAGKPAKVALTACMRKLLIICNAIMRDQAVRADA